MKIGELAARANLNASAIRYYEKLGLLAAPQRLGGQRRYSSDALSRVLLIRFATDMGFTLAEIKLFLSGLRDNTLVGPPLEETRRAQAHRSRSIHRPLPPAQIPPPGPPPLPLRLSPAMRPRSRPQRKPPHSLLRLVVVVRPSEHVFSQMF